MPDTPFEVEVVRRDFPILATQVREKKLCYLDNAASTQKPRAVIDRLQEFYSRENANIHRGVHHLGELATDAYHDARKTVAKFLNAKSDKQVIFTRGTTESINLVATSWGRANLQKGDQILLTAMEHHANIVPWQLIAEQTGAVIKVIPTNDRAELDLDAYDQLLGEHTRILAICHISNSLGTLNPIKDIIAKAKAMGAITLVDGAQGAPHLGADVQDLNCDFYAFSGHKIYGPTGIGILYGNQEIMENMPPYQGGGDMIQRVSFEKTTYKGLPERFEAGTPNIAGAAGLAAAIKYLGQFNQADIKAHESALLEYALGQLEDIDGITLYTKAVARTGVVSFNLEGVHAHDIATILDREGVAIRAGNHCTQPLMKTLGVPATARTSFALYNTKEEIDTLAASIIKARQLFK
ncbi:MAG: cysteine desulfurase [Opitutae bacterium]|jgi:cysteine desulfurase/selenocysteine lyase|nr:cysteine desulfurase [Opitutae bacterium]MBT7852929.1 cysteine desulfurase [Opitutae bacterium]